MHVEESWEVNMERTQMHDTAVMVWAGSGFLLLRTRGYQALFVCSCVLGFH